MHSTLLAILILALICAMAKAADAPSGDTAATSSVEVLFRVEDRVLNTIDPLVFGQFMEIASWGELGPEAVVDPETGQLPDDIVELLRQLHAPIVRFPGGIDIDYIDWTDRIDHAPGRPAGSERPMTETRGHPAYSNHFGYDEFLDLAEEIGTLPQLVVNLRDGMGRDADVQAAADHAAALVAYCNADADDPRLPESMRAWAKLRQTNGREQPWAVKHWQVGNEIFGVVKRDGEALGLSEDPETWARDHADRLVTFAKTMRAVDPSIVLICDAWFHDLAKQNALLTDPRLAEHYDFVTAHTYGPGGTVKYFRGDGEAQTEVSADDLTLRDFWYAWVSTPGAVDGSGDVVGKPRNARFETFFAFPGDLAVTEWNWNGWGPGINDHPDVSFNAAGLGAASYLQGIMRQGDRIKLANQSMMLGVSWGLASIHVDPDGEHEPFISPTGAATALYSQYHGSERLAIEAVGPQPAITQDLTLKGWGTHPGRSPLPLLDPLVTRSDDAVFIHVVQRSFERPIRAAFDLSEVVGNATGSARVRALIPRSPDHPGAAKADAMRRSDESVDFDGGVLEIDLPARSVLVIELPLGVARPR
jgi:alpha-N-arabinofuranosidase